MTGPIPIAGATFAWSAALTVILLACYPAYQYNGFRMTTQQPFTDWRDVKNTYYNLVGTTFAPANLTAALMSLALCTTPSYRANIVPANRSAACACLYGINQNFLASNLSSLNGTCTTPAACTAAGDASVGCLRYRGVWSFYAAGHLHPAALALTCNASVMIVALASLMALYGLSTLYICVATAAPTLAIVITLLVLQPVDNCLYACVLLAVWVSVAVGLQDELMDLATCCWAGIPLTTAALGAYLAVGTTVHDLVGILCFACIGYLAGLFPQRAFWTRTHPPPSPYREWILFALGGASVAAWLSLIILAYTNWFSGGPFAAGVVALILLLFMLGVAVAEFVAAFYPGTEAWIEFCVLLVLLLTHGVFSITAIVDASLA